MSDTNRWAAFSDEELRSLHAGDDPGLDAEMREELHRRESEKATYRGPGLYKAGERRLEVLGTTGDPKIMGVRCSVVMRDEGDSSGILMLEYLHDFNTVDSSGWRTYEYLGPLVPERVSATVKLIASGSGEAILETWDGSQHTLRRGDELTVPVAVLS